MKTKFHNVTGLELAYNELSVKIMNICRKLDCSFFISDNNKEELKQELQKYLKERDILKSAMHESP